MKHGCTLMDLSYYTSHMFIGISVDSSNNTCLDHHDHWSAMSVWDCSIRQTGNCCSLVHRLFPHLLLIAYMVVTGNKLHLWEGEFVFSQEGLQPITQAMVSTICFGCASNKWKVCAELAVQRLVVKQCHNNYISEGSVWNSNRDNITLIVFHEMLYKSVMACIIFHCVVYTSVMVWL